MTSAGLGMEANKEIEMKDVISEKRASIYIHSYSFPPSLATRLATLISVSASPRSDAYLPNAPTISPKPVFSAVTTMSTSSIFLSLSVYATSVQCTGMVARKVSMLWMVLT